MARSKRIPGVDPDYYRRQRDALLRRHRQVILLNDKELEAIEEYRRRYNIKSSRATLLREAIMDKILSGLDESHPTLF